MVSCVRGGVCGVLVMLASAVPASLAPAVSAAEPAPAWRVWSLAQPTSFPRLSEDEVQEVKFKATGGSFRLSFEGQRTGEIDCRASAGEVRSALEGLGTLGSGSVEVSGGPCSSKAYAVTFTGRLADAIVAPLAAESGTVSPLEDGSEQASVEVVARPTGANGGYLATGRYLVFVQNVGGAASSGQVSITDVLPPGVTATAEPTAETLPLRCTLRPPAPDASEVLCAGGSVGALGEIAPLEIPVAVSAGAAGSVLNEVTVSGGGAATSVVTSEPSTVPTPVGGTPSPEGEIESFAFGVFNGAGEPDERAGDRPNGLTTEFDLTSEGRPEGLGGCPEEVERPCSLTPTEEPRDLVFYLPLGLVGDPLAAERCPLSRFMSSQAELECPLGSVVGRFTAILSLNKKGNVWPGLPLPGELGNAIVNLTPEGGFPAELGFYLADVSERAIAHASVVRAGGSYMLRVSVPGMPEGGVQIYGVAATFFGDPAGHLGLSGSGTAFLTNPADCSAGPLKARMEVDFWQHPGKWVQAEDTVYPRIEGCGLLNGLFEPSFEMAPEVPEAEAGAAPEGGAEGAVSFQADEPSRYEVELKVPQHQLFGEPATPDLKGASVTLPEGVSMSPSAAQGLAGCAEHGPEGIDIPDGNGPHGEALHPDEAWEGEEIGPDGLSHLARGHCPKASRLGTVQIVTPLLEKPLKGHVYLAAPKCGGQGRRACTEADATNGELYGIYLEAVETEGAKAAEGEHPGVVVKLAGKIAADPVSGRLTATFSENPQFPFSELRMRFHGGPRAPLANPQACGSYATSYSLSTYAGQEVTGLAPPFPIGWDGEGGACPSSLPFAPGFSAGTTNPVAGAFSPFVLSFSRQDREQELGGLSVTLPPGLLGRVAGVPLCGEAQANAGTCGPESQVGTASALAGSGEHPLYVSGGRVYLTTGYGGGPFGLSIVVPAVAGPFDLGDVVVRAAIHINPGTARVTVVSDPLPLSKDGVPFRLREVRTEITRAGGFTFNPTSCERETVAGTITGVPVKAGEGGASASVSSPFAVKGCAGLPFHPSFSVYTQGSTSKADGASLTVKVAQRPGEANIHKVDLTLPKALPARLTTLQKACTEAQFDANPAGCPEGSVIGHAVARTPVLSSPLEGPGYLVSHGGAAFPDVEFVLQGEGVTIMLDGQTQIKSGVTYSRFETVPDAPISSFETTLPESPHSALTTMRPGRTNLCRTHLRIPTVIVGQNGAGVTQNTSVQVTGCSTRIAIFSHRIRGRRLKLKVYVPAAGRVTVRARGLTRRQKSAKARDTLAFTLRQQRPGKLATRLKVTYVPTIGKKRMHQIRTLRVRFRR
jgi:hypothetical protein